MEDETNQSSAPEVNDDAGIFADESNDDQQTTETEPNNDSATDDMQTDDDVSGGDDPLNDYLTIKYNGAEENLTYDEAVELAQKGKNYDKIYNRLQELQNDPVRQVFEEQAKQAGMTLPEYADRLKQFQQESRVQSIANDFKEKNPDVTDEVAEQFARERYKNELTERQVQEEQARMERDAAIESQAQAQVKAFMELYPNVDIETLPEEVIQDIDQHGETLLSAYRAYQNRQLKAELEAARANNDNRSKSTGSLGTNAGNDNGGDDFLKGLLG